MFCFLETVFVEVFNGDNECSNDRCHIKIEELKKKIDLCEKRILEAKDEYHKSLVANLKKDIILEDLKKKLNQLEQSYMGFKGTFSEGALSVLASFDTEIKKDTKFILTAVKDLYRNDLHRLKNKTYSGRNKEKMTPKKMESLKSIFNERIKNQEDSDIRMKNFGKYVKIAIENINKM